jgi:hypothetical protein
MKTAMARFTGPRWARACALSLALACAASCGDRAANARAAADSDLARDLALAGNSSAQPTFQDTAIAPAPTPASRAKANAPAPTRVRAGNTAEPKVQRERPQHVAQTPVQQTPAAIPAPQPAAPAPTPAPAPAPALATIANGTGMPLTSGSKVCTSNLPGDKLVATVNSAITGANGAIIPAGSQVVLEVASVTPAQSGDAPITFRVRAIVVNDKTYTVAAEIAPVGPLQETKVADSDPNGDKKKVIGGAIIGAILGQMIGHNTKGTVIGAAAGAATGAAVAKSGQKTEGCLPAGSPMRLTLDAPLVLTTT